MEHNKAALSNRVRWLLATVILLTVVLLPLLRYRWVYEENRRLRVVSTGELYRSGRLTANGLERAIRELKIKTVINLMDEDTEPMMKRTFFGGGTVAERDICESLGTKYIFLHTDLVNQGQVGKEAPKAIGAFLDIMNNPDNHPVLLHCKAGLHRTGVLTAVYRMSVHGWSPFRAWEELRANGFGEYKCYADNEYILQYLLSWPVSETAGLQSDLSDPAEACCTEKRK